MKASKKISKPENWQDFELLCKRLWWEIWKCDEIKKNGRQWQNQSWVDIYWIPKWETKYYWIQCKWKDDYTSSKLTKKDVDTEIKKAKNFNPKLKKYYFATTWNKDVEIEEYIREKNLESISKWLFEIHLFSWEDMVDLINENPNTYQFYIESINFKDEYNVDLVFDNWKGNIDIELLFSEKTKKYIYKEPIKSIYWNSDLSLIMKNLQLNNSFSWWEHKWENMSWWNINLVLKNNWTKQLENYKIYWDFRWNIETLDEKDWTFQMLNYQYRTVFLDNEKKQWTLKPLNNKPLVPKDSYSFDNIDFKPKIEWWKILINWSLVSSHFNKTWSLEINIKTNLIKEEEIIEVNNLDEVKEEKIIENYYKME